MTGTDRTANGAEGRLMVARILDLKILAPLFRLIGNSRALDRLAAAIFALGILVVAAYAVVRPDYNWDMVAYVATAIEDDYPAAEDLHRETWSRIEAGASERQLSHLKFSSPYNLNQWEKPEDFKSQLSMYRVKVAYVAALKALEPVIGVVKATFLLSILPSVLFGTLVLWWLWREKALQAAFLVLPVLMVADYLPLSTVVTPDMLVSFVSLVAIYALWRGHDWLAAVLLVLSVTIRPDNLVLLIAAAMTAVLFGWRKAPMLLALAAGFAVAIYVSKAGHHPGWWPHFYFSNVQIQNSMADFNPPFTVQAFAKGYARGLIVSFQHNDWIWLLAMLSLGWALLTKAGKINHPRVHALAFMLFIATLGKFASFPLPDDRFYFVFIAGFALVLLAAWKPQFSWNGPAKSAANHA